MWNCWHPCVCPCFCISMELKCSSTFIGGVKTAVTKVPKCGSYGIFTIILAVFSSNSYYSYYNYTHLYMRIYAHTFRNNCTDFKGVF